MTENAREITPTMAALIFDNSDETFKLALPATDTNGDERLPVQVLALIGLMIRLNKDQSFVEEHLEWTQKELINGIPEEFQDSIGTINAHKEH